MPYTGNRAFRSVKRPRSRLHRLHGGGQVDGARRGARRRAGDDRDRRADGRGARQADRRGLRGGRRGRVPGPRGRGRRRAARAGRRRRDRARRRQRPLRAGPRGARAPRRRLARRSTRRRGLAADRPQRPPARHAAPRTSRACSRSACRSTRSSPTRSCRRAIAASSPARCPRSLALAELPAGTQDALGRQRLRRVPGLRRPRPARRRAGGRCAGRRFCVTDSDRRRRSTPSGSAPLAARVEVEPGEAAKTMAEAERVLRELARAGMTREDHVVALGGGVVGDLAGFCAHLYQRGVPGRPGADHARRPGRLRLRRQDRRRPARGQELRRRLPPAGGGDRRHLDPGDAAAGGARGRLRRGAEDRPAGGRRALGAGRERSSRSTPPRSTTSSSPAPATSARSSPPTSATRGLRPSSTSATPSATRSRRRAATARYRHGEAVGLGLLAALRLSEAPELRDEVEAILRRHGLPVALDPAIDVDEILDALQRDKKRTAEGVGFVLLAEPGEPRDGAAGRSG